MLDPEIAGKLSADNGIAGSVAEFAEDPVMREAVQAGMDAANKKLSRVAGLECPLIGIEPWARAHPDMAPLPASGFIDYYLTGVLYPEVAAAMMRNLVFGVVVFSWVGFLISARRRRTGGQPGARAARDEKPPADRDHGPGPDRDNVC